MSKRKAELDDEHNKEQKKQKKSCLACSGIASTTFNLCSKGCKYDVCVDCIFGFTEMRHGKTFDKMRIKCMICREPLPTHNNEKTITKLLSRRNKFYVILDDTINGDRVVLAKDPISKDITLSRISEYVTSQGVLVQDSEDDEEEISLADLVRSTPAFIPSGAMAQLAHVLFTTSYPPPTTQNN